MSDIKAINASTLTQTYTRTHAQQLKALPQAYTHAQKQSLTCLLDYTFVYVCVCRY